MSVESGGGGGGSVGGGGVGLVVGGVVGGPQETQEHSYLDMDSYPNNAGESTLSHFLRGGHAWLLNYMSTRSWWHI